MEMQTFTFEVATASSHIVQFNFILYGLQIFSYKNINGTQADNIVSNFIANNFL
jgi:hypothetical protein